MSSKRNTAISSGDTRKNNNKNENSLLTYLLTYLVRNRDKPREHLNTNINREVYEEFFDVCRKLDLLKRRRHPNVALEGLMKYFVELYGDRPTVVQSTLFYKPEINMDKVELNIAQKLELKMVKKELDHTLDSLHKGRGERSFYINRLLSLTKKGIRVWRKTRDDELGDMLKEAKQFV